MKKIILFISIVTLLIGCKESPLSPDRFKTGTFEIPEGKGYSRTVITRIDSLQIEQYEERIDSFSILWKNNFNYSLKMTNPKSALDEEIIYVKITNIEKKSYDFEAVIGHSNYTQKGTITKIAD
jgi:hypothetical protein